MFFPLSCTYLIYSYHYCVWKASVVLRFLI